MTELVVYKALPMTKTGNQEAPTSHVDNKQVLSEFPTTETQHTCQLRQKTRRRLIILIIFLLVISCVIRITRHTNDMKKLEKSNSREMYDYESNSDTSIQDQEDFTDDINWDSTWPTEQITHKHDWNTTTEQYLTTNVKINPHQTTSKAVSNVTRQTTSKAVDNVQTTSKAVGKVPRRTTAKPKALYPKWTKIITYSMNKGSTPCRDFYQYSCGGWISKTQIPNHFNHFSKFQELNRHAAKTVNQYLDRKAATPEERNMEKFYKNCNQYGRSNRLTVLANLNKLVQRLSQWTLTSTYSNANFESLLISLNKLNSWPIFQLLPRVSTNNETVVAVSVGDLSISTGYLATVPDVPGLKLSDKVMGKLRPKLSLLNRAYENEAKKSSGSSASSILDTHSTINKLIFHKIWKVPLQTSSYYPRYTPYYSRYRPSNRNEVTATKLAEAVLGLEVDLLLARKHGPFTKYTKTVEEYSVTQLQRRCGIVTWDRYLKELTSKDVGKVVLLKPNTIFKICDVVKRYTGSLYSANKKKLQNYVLLRLIKNLMKYYGISILIDDKFYSDKLAKTAAAAKSTECWQWTSRAFQLVAGNIYLKETNFVVDRYRKKVEIIVANVRDQYKTLLQKSTWLDVTTRAKAIAKVDNLYIKLFYPPVLKDSTKLRAYTRKLPMYSSTWYYSVLQWMKFEFDKTKYLFSQPVNRSVWTVGPHEVNAVHTPWFNDVIIPAAIMQQPFFDDNRPMAMNFGALGSIVGHEISHSVVGYAGTHCNQYGQVDDWVTWESKLHLQKTSKCFLDLYKSINSKFNQLNGNRTLEEDISDNAGIEAAFGAYQTWKSNNREVLSNETEAWMKAENLNMDQLFFLAYSQMNCGKWNEDGLKTLSSRKHSPGLLRVNGSFVVNEFMRSAFSCHQLGGSRCDLW